MKPRARMVLLAALSACAGPSAARPAPEPATSPAPVVIERVPEPSPAPMTVMIGPESDTLIEALAAAGAPETTQTTLSVRDGQILRYWQVRLPESDERAPAEQAAGRARAWAVGAGFIATEPDADPPERYERSRPSGAAERLDVDVRRETAYYSKNPHGPRYHLALELLETRSDELPSSLAGVLARYPELGEGFPVYLAEAAGGQPIAGFRREYDSRYTQDEWIVQFEQRVDPQASYRQLAAAARPWGFAFDPAADVTRESQYAHNRCTGAVIDMHLARDELELRVVVPEPDAARGPCTE